MTCRFNSSPVLAVVLTIAVATACSAQDGVPDPRAQPVEAVEHAVYSLFDAMRAADSAAVRAAFHPDATLHSVSREDDGDSGYRITSTPIDAFVETVGGEHPLYDERIGDVHVQADDGLATAWMAYSFYIGEEFSHCGVNAFQYVLTDDGWKILHVTDTRRKDCH